MGRIEIHVVGDEELPRADYGHPGSGMHIWFANIRLAVVVLLQLFAQAFELPSAHIFEIGAVRPRRRRFVKKHWNQGALPDFGAHTPRQRHAILNGPATYWHEHAPP